jgi:hypothetical protein
LQPPPGIEIPGADPGADRLAPGKRIWGSRAEAGRQPPPYGQAPSRRAFTCRVVDLAALLEAIVIS